MLAFLSTNPLLNSKLQEGTAQMPLHELGADHRQTRILRTHTRKNTLLINEKGASKFPKTKKKSQIPYHPTKKKSKYTSNKLTSTFSVQNSQTQRRRFFFSTKTSRFQALSKKRRAKVIHLHLRKSQGTSAWPRCVFLSQQGRSAKGVGAYVCDYM